MKQIYIGKTIVIAGGGSGIGRALALQLAGQSAAICIIDKNQAAGKKSQQLVQQTHKNCKFYVADMTKSDQVKNAVKNIIDDVGGIDYFFNCVGIVQGGEVSDTPLSTSEQVFGTNITSMLNGVQYVYPHMIERQSGHIIHFGSTAGLLPTPFMATYAATKAAIISYSQSLRAEAKSNNVKVSVVCPGFVKTPIYETAFYDNVNKQKALHILFHRIPIQSPDHAARRIIKGVIKNKAIIHTWYSLRIGWLFYRLLPNVYVWSLKYPIRSVRKHLQN